MNLELIPFSSELVRKQAVSEVISMNEYTRRFGLALTEADAIALVETREGALRDNGRIEFGGGAIDKIIREFCDSPYLSSVSYAETIHELTEIFYSYKNETLDLITDDELIRAMKAFFDGGCQGSLELLRSRELYRLARNLRFRYSADPDEEEPEEEYEGEWDE